MGTIKYGPYTIQIPGPPNLPLFSDNSNQNQIERTSQMKNVKISVKATCKHCQESIDLEEAGMHLRFCRPDIASAISVEHNRNINRAQSISNSH